MNKITIVTIVVLITLLAGIYYYFSGKEYVIQLSETDIQSKLEEKLPLTKSYFFIIQITLDNPRVHLENGSDMVSVGLDVVFNITLNKSPKPIGGTLDVSGGVLYLAEKGEFYLTNPIIDNLTVQGIAQKYVDKANRALSKALAEYYKNNPIYTLHVTDMKQAVAKLALKDVVVQNKQLVITLGI